MTDISKPPVFNAGNSKDTTEPKVEPTVSSVPTPPVFGAPPSLGTVKKINDVSEIKSSAEQVETILHEQEIAQNADVEFKESNPVRVAPAFNDIINGKTGSKSVIPKLPQPVTEVIPQINVEEEDEIDLVALIVNDEIVQKKHSEAKEIPEKYTELEDDEEVSDKKSVKKEKAPRKEKQEKAPRKEKKAVETTGEDGEEPKKSKTLLYCLIGLLVVVGGAYVLDLNGLLDIPFI